MFGLGVIVGVVITCIAMLVGEFIHIKVESMQEDKDEQDPS